MLKKEQGVLTVEATIVSMIFVMFVLFLYNFAGVYRAQSLVSHATIEAADAVALESYLREVAFESDPQEVVYLASKLGGSGTLDADSLESLRTADLPRIARDKFVAAIAKNETEADKKLKQLGVKDGLAGIDFSKCHADLDGDNIVVFLDYTIEFQFPVFGAREIRVTKAAKAKTFGEILYSVTTSSNNPQWGNTSGDKRVEYGDYVEISATPNFGYRFVKWDDGNMDNPRRVLVTDVAKYKAIFEPTDIGINLYLKRAHTDTSYRWDEEQEYGAVTGAGEYTYLGTATISATEKEHYNFAGWDDNGDGKVDSTENPRQVVVDKTHNITAIYEAEKYKVTILCKEDNYGKVNYEYTKWDGTTSGNSKELWVEYKHDVKLFAVPESTYRFDRWENNSSEKVRTVTVLGDTTYVAHFEKDTCKVNFYVNNELYSTQEVVIGSSIAGSSGQTGAKMPDDPKLSKKYFTGWVANAKEFTSITPVRNTIRVDAQLVTPSITIEGGATGQNSTTFTVKTVPENATVNWSSSDNNLATVNSNGKVTAKSGSGTVVITATLTYFESTESDSVTIELGESQHRVVYCMNMGGGRRYYTKEHTALIKTTKWGVYFPGSNHHCFSTKCCDSHADKTVGYTELFVTSKKVSGEGKAANVVHDVGGYNGYNKSGIEGYIFDNGSGNAIYFHDGQVSDGPEGFLIKKITY